MSTFGFGLKYIFKKALKFGKSLLFVLTKTQIFKVCFE